MTKDGDNRVGMPMPHRELLLEVCYLLHMGERAHLLKLPHPVLNRLPILLLNRRKIGRWAREFLLSHGRILVNLKTAGKARKTTPNRASNSPPRRAQRDSSGVLRSDVGVCRTNKGPESI